jgi:hypothetical protein
MRITKKKIAGVVAATAVVALGSTAAFAYWTGAGSADGSTQLAAGIQDVTAALTIDNSGTLLPGASVLVHSATITNPNSFGVNVVGFGTATFTATGSCDVSWFSLQNLPASVPAVPVAGSTTTAPIDVSALNIRLAMSNLPTTDQGSCKNQTVTVHVPLQTQQQ